MYLNLYYHSLYNSFHSDIHGRLSGNIKPTGLNSILNIPLENTSDFNRNCSFRVHVLRDLKPESRASRLLS